jgi:hypothetical protein
MATPRYGARRDRTPLIISRFGITGLLMLESPTTFWFTVFRLLFLAQKINSHLNQIYFAMTVLFVVSVGVAVVGPIYVRPQLLIGVLLSFFFWWILRGSSGIL